MILEDKLYNIQREMQLDREEIDDPAATLNVINLEKHFKEHGLSNRAY